MLEVRDLRTGYGGVDVIHGIDLAVGAHETIAILGANGAGKSTLLNAINRQIPIWSGTVHFKGQPLTNAKTFIPIRIGIGYVPEGRGMLTTLSVRENLEVGAHGRRLLSRFRVNRDRVLDLFPALRLRLPEPAGNLSGGQQQMLAIARALMGEPDLVILDEPSLGLAPKVVNEVYDALSQLKRTGQAILLVEQAIGKAIALSDRVYVLSRGKVVLSGSADRIRNDPMLASAYLGF